MGSGLLMVCWSGLLGLALGSFMNVCIYRLPIKKSIVSPPSSCPECGRKIRFYDNIPLLSYFILRGKCRYCGTPMAWHYPVVEALAGLLSIALFIRYGLSYQYILSFLFTASLVTASFIDLHHRIIPDVITLPGIAAGWAVSLLPGTISWQDAIIGTLAGGGSLFIIAFVYEKITGREGMGGGDIKLLAMIGAWMGWRYLYLTVLLASVAGVVVGVVFLLVAGKGFRARIPFGPFLSLGAMACFFFGPAMMNGLRTFF